MTVAEGSVEFTLGGVDASAASAASAAFEGNPVGGLGAEVDIEATQQTPQGAVAVEQGLEMVGHNEGTTQQVLVMQDIAPMNVELGGDFNADNAGEEGDEGITILTQVLYDVPLNTHSRAQVRLAEEEARRESASLAEIITTPATGEMQ